MDRDDGIKMLGYLHRVSKDHDGEITMTLKISSEYKHYAMNLPEKTTFQIIFKESDE